MITNKDTETLQFIQNYWLEKRMSPSLQEIANAFGLASKNSSKHRVARLVRKNLIQLDSIGRIMIDFDFVCSHICSA
jgi:SOS-response transcriptional repressor LexA